MPPQDRVPLSNAVLLAPLLRPDFHRLMAAFAARQVPYRFVSTGWYVKRLMPLFDRHPPEAVRLSLSGATESVHDAIRTRQRSAIGLVLPTKDGFHRCRTASGLSWRLKYGSAARPESSDDSRQIEVTLHESMLSDPPE